MSNTLSLKAALAGLLAIIGLSLPALGLAAAPETTTGFVCPVLSETVGEHNPNTFGIADGDYSLVPSGEPHYIDIPVGATNDNGAGSPGDSHAGPGDPGYTAIWGA